MALRECTALLLFTVLIALAYSDTAADVTAACAKLNSTATSNSNFTLTISPTSYIANQTYNVTLKGAGNVTVIIQALFNASNVGSWPQANLTNNCSGSPIFLNQFPNGNETLTANWTAPNNGTTAVIRVFIINGTESYIINNTLAANVPTLCDKVNSTAPSNNNYTLTVSPTSYIANRTYNVTLKGSGNVTVILQALFNASNVGSWPQANLTNNCSGSPIFLNQFPYGNETLTTNWTAPNNGTSVVIRAFIINGTENYSINTTLVNVVATTPATTKTTTKNMASAKHPSSMFMIVIQSLGLIAIISKLLS
ncbi:uncharacterized protein O3C94_014883 [Discoglossus pictus]